MLLFQISDTSHVMLDWAGTMLMMLDELIHVYVLLSEVGLDMQVAWQRLSRRGAIPRLAACEETNGHRPRYRLRSGRDGGALEQSVTTNFRHIVTGAARMPAGQNENRLALDIF